ncbi:hypothetical protein [Tabrizicola sp.]|uniref:hypothetical protein n=1 Tax=Tabrizicola sp. TaxID=2005166 RepID=UPI00286CEE46|nr:hypothetical protein [Tabrizicola sp.]
MPPIDLNALKAKQTEAARARLALDRHEEKLTGLLAERRDAEAALQAAGRAGNAAAARRAVAAAERLGLAVEQARRIRADLIGALDVSILGTIDLGFDAPGDVPMLLLPVRLETRFGKDAAGAPVLRIRIHPDDIHIDLTDPGVTAEEAAAARAYWSVLFAATDDSGMADGWATFVATVGKRRARLVSRALRPLNAGARGTGAAPDFPEVAPPAHRASRPRLLPDVFRVMARQGRQELTATGNRVAQDLRIGLLADDGSQLIDRDGLKVLAGTEWLFDYAAAEAAGMAITLPLASANTPIERVFVYGVTGTRRPQDTAAEFAALLAAHDGGPGLAFVPQGTPTNNTEAASSDWRRWMDPPPLPLTPVGTPADANGSVTAAALGLGAAGGVLDEVPGAALREQGAAAAMNAALWPATWGYFLGTLDQDEKALDTPLVEGLRQFHQSHVRGRGRLPVLRVGDQPYGLLPFAGFQRAAPAGGDRTERGLDTFLRRALPNWLNAVGDLPRIGPNGSAETVLKIFGSAPLSWGVRARKCLSRDLLIKVQAATDEAKPAAEVEALLTQLLAESLGGFSYVYGAGSLDTASLPVMLPYADPSRDAVFMQALLDGRAGGAISSVFQALVGLGWARLQAEAKPPPRAAEALRATARIDPVLTERVIGTVTGPDTMAAADYAGILAQMTAAGDGLPQVRGMGVLPMGAARDWAEVTLQATSIAERDFWGHHLGGLLVGAKQRLAAMREGLQTLVALSASPEGGDLSMLVAEALDTASHRLDAWACGLSSARLDRMRATAGEGLTVGAYGWLFDLRPAPRAKPEGGFVAAPSLELATTAGLLRSAYLAHNPADGSGGAFAIDLSSGRVRRALALVEGVANGQTLGALLGYDFERRLHEGLCDRFVMSFRGIAPLAAASGAPVTDAEAQALAGVNVTDMLRLMDLWGHQGEGAAGIFTRLAVPPKGNEYLDPEVIWKAPTPAERKVIEAAMAAGMADADAVADLLMAESVHQLASGNLARAAAALDAGGKGEAPPPAAPDVIQSGGPGTIITHRVIALCPPGGGWGAPTPRTEANPAVEAWAAARLPDPGKVVLGEKAGGGKATLADARIGAADFAALARHGPTLDRLIRARAPLANPEAPLVAAGVGIIGAGEMAFEEATLTALALQEVLDGAEPLGPLQIGLPEAQGWAPVAGAVAAALARLATAAGMLQARLQTLQGLLTGQAVARADLTAALVDLAEFGIVMPNLREAQAADLAVLALNEGAERLARAMAAQAAPALTAATVATVATALFGEGTPVPLAQVFAAGVPGEVTGDRAVTPPSPGAAERYLADFGTVRPAIGRMQRMNLLSGIFGRGPQLVVRQLVGLGEDPPDVWIGEGISGDRRSPTAPVVSLLADAPAGFDLTQPVTGLLIDDWTETTAQRQPMGKGGPVVSRTTAGVAIHADAPGAEPPQSLILALSPDGNRWTEERMRDLLTDMIEMAQARLVTLETLPLAARVLPAIYTQSWSLQGTPAIDWSKLLGDKAALAVTEGIKSFTMLREG